MRATADESAFLLITRSVSLAATVSTRAITPSPPFLCPDPVRLRPIRGTSDNRGGRGSWVQGERRENEGRGIPSIIAPRSSGNFDDRGARAVFYGTSEDFHEDACYAESSTPLFSFGYCLPFEEFFCSG